MNKAILMGRLTKEPELRYSSNGSMAICSFTIAVNRNFVKQGEERQADFIPVVAFGKTGEFCSKYFHKGQQVAIVGRIQTRTWDDNDGKKHYATEVIAEEAHFADSKRQDGAGPSKPYTDSSNSGGGDSDSRMPVSEGGFRTKEDDDDLPF